MLTLNKEQTLHVIETQLVNRKQALEITGQTSSGFSQSIRLGKIKPFVTFGEAGSRPYSLYYRTDIEEYARTKSQSNVKQRL